jgi:type VI secretion system protein ImpA
MATQFTIEIEELLKPIPGKNGAGREAKEGKQYELLKEARREEEALNQGDWKREVKTADWGKVVQIATKILSSESKDLEVAVWLLEGLVKRQGFVGLRDGLRLLREMHVRLWELMYPSIEDGDLEYRTGRLEVLNKILPLAIKHVPLVHSPGGAAYAYWQYKESQDIENLKRGAASDPEKRRQLQEALDDGKLEGDKFEKVVAGTSLAHCSSILDQLVESQVEFDALEKMLDEKYGENGPSLRLVREALKDCLSFMDGVVKKKGGIGLQTAQSLDSRDDSQEARMNIPSADTANGELRDRAGALRQLAAVAEFFRKTEPHSPVSYLVQRAARWGEMPLEEWLQEVIKNEGVLGEVRETLGLGQGTTTTQEHQ